MDRLAQEGRRDASKRERRLCSPCPPGSRGDGDSGAPDRDRPRRARSTTVSPTLPSSASGRRSRAPATRARTGSRSWFPRARRKSSRASSSSGARPEGLRPVGLAARDTLRLEAKMALYGNDIDDEHTVLEADLGWIVKWQKGDFIGPRGARRTEGARHPAQARRLRDGRPRDRAARLSRHCDGRDVRNR